MIKVKVTKNLKKMKSKVHTLNTQDLVFSPHSPTAKQMGDLQNIKLP